MPGISRQPALAEAGARQLLDAMTNVSEKYQRSVAGVSRRPLLAKSDELSPTVAPCAPIRQTGGSRSPRVLGVFECRPASEINARHCHRRWR